MTKTIISAEERNTGTRWREIWRYRDLFWLLAYRDYRIRYAQTFLGMTWAVLQPATTLLIFTVVFGFALHVDTFHVPYPLYAICGLTAWTFFAYVLSNSGNSIIGAQQMIKKIFFPRLIIPLSKAIVGFVDYAIAFVFLIALMIYYSFTPSHHLVYLPVFIILTILAALSIGIWMSALTIRFRDFQHIIPFMVQVGLYATPVAYPTELVINNIPSWGTTLFYLNPMVGIMEGYRWSILSIGGLQPLSFLSFAMILLLFITGIWYFRRMERIMADIV